MAQTVERARTEPAGRPRVMTTSIDGEGIATITLDGPELPVNVMNVPFVEDLEHTLDELTMDLKGLILASAKERNFVAGADLTQLLAAPGAADASEMARRLQRALARLESLPYPTVAAINGAALGGGLELTLACDYRVCVEDSGNILGLPEVSLGLLPAGGGCQRLPRLIGLTRALGLILEGKRYSPRRARKYGVVDDVVHPAILERAARSWLQEGKRGSRPSWGRIDMAAERWAPVRTLVYRQSEKRVGAKTRGHYPAPLEALDAVRSGMEQGFGAGLAAEAVAFGELATGPVAKNLIHLFFATEGLKGEQRALIREARSIERTGVIGAGFMGSGIAQALAAAGYEVRLRDVDPARVAGGLKGAGKLTRDAARKGRFSRYEAQAIQSRLSGSVDYTGLGRADLVIEAVFEDVEVKRAVIAELEERMEPGAIIASNTSSLPIGSLAAGARHPERILGMHFFSPVHKMPLLEIIRADGTSDAALATAVAAGKRMGKTVIVVADGPGFYTTRVLGFMAQEAGRLFEAGASIEDIDRAMTHFGFPVGPLALTDEVGVEVAAHVAEILGTAFPERFTGAEHIKRMVADGRLGRKSGKGFYDYSGKRKKPDPAMYALRNSGPQSFPRDLIQRRLALAFVNEAARCLEEGVIASARDGDVGAVMGIGFPPFLGGPFRYADSLGIDAVVKGLGQMEYAYGSNFAPAGLLVRMAADGSRFYEGET